MGRVVRTTRRIRKAALAISVVGVVTTVATDSALGVENGVPKPLPMGRGDYGSYEAVSRVK